MNNDAFKSKTIWAVVGSCHNPEKYAYRIYNYLKKRGLQVYAVDPSGKTVDNRPSYKTLEDLPMKPEAVDMVINPIRGEEYLEEAKRLGISYIWFQPGAESPELIKKAQNYNMNVVHNACVMVDLI
jgi:predicted CoA-binding protein